MVKRRSFFTGLFESKIFFVALVLILAYLLAHLAINILELKQYTAKISSIETDIDQMNKRNLQLKDIIAFLESDEATEDLAREKLGLIKKGEQAVIVTPEGQLIQKDREKSHNNKTPLRRWFTYFFGIKTL